MMHVQMHWRVSSSWWEIAVRLRQELTWVGRGNIAASVHLWQMFDMFTFIGDSYTGEFHPLSVSAKLSVA